MDIVYLVKDCTENEELTYSLRSLVNIPHDRVFIVGGCPRNIDTSKVIHFPILQTDTKYKNTTNNLKLICNQDNLSEDFILFNDDFFILKPIQIEELNICRGTVREVLKEYKNKYGFNSYIEGMEQTSIFLNDLGIKDVLSYELHIPMVMNKTNVLKMFSLPFIKCLNVLHKRTMYGNLFHKNSKPMKDVKVLDFNTKVEYDKFLSCSDSGWFIICKYIRNLFPDKSIYEK